MPFQIPNATNATVRAATYAGQGMLDTGDVDILVAADFGTFALSGCAVTPHNSGVDTNVNVAAGQVSVQGSQVAVSAVTNLAVAAGGSQDRVDLVVVDSNGAVSVIAGTAAGTADFALITSDSNGNLTRVVLAAVWVPANATSITASNIIDKRSLGGAPIYGGALCSQLTVIGHSWTAGTNGVVGQNGVRGNIVGHLLGLLGMDSENVLHLGTNGATLTGNDPNAHDTAWLQGITWSGWPAVLQGVVPPAARAMMYAGTTALTNDVGDRAFLCVAGVNDPNGDQTFWPTLGVTAWKNALRTVISRAMAGQVYTVIQSGSSGGTGTLGVTFGGTVAKTTGFGTNLAQTNSNSGAGVIRSTANNDKLTLTIPSDFAGGTIAVCFIGTAAGGTTLGAAITSTTATSITLSAVGSLPTSGTVVIKIDSEEMLVTAGLGTTTLTVTRGVNGTTAATHSNGATVTTASDTYGVTVGGTASGASGTITLSGQGCNNCQVPVVKRFTTLTAADAGKTLTFTVAGIVSGDTSATIDFDSWWIEAAVPPPVLICNIPRYLYSSHTASEITNNWAPTNTATTSVVGEFGANVQVVDIDSLYYATTGTVHTTILSGDATISVDAQGARFPVAVGSRIRIDTEDLFVTAVSGSGPYTLTVTRGVNGTAAAGHSVGAWVSDATLMYTDNLHPNGFGASRIARKIVSTLLTALPSMGPDTSAITSTRYNQQRNFPSMGIPDASYVTCVANAYNAVAPSQNQTYAHPIYVPERCIVTACGLNVTTGQASTTARLGIYAQDGTGGRPGSLIADFGAVATTAAQWNEITGLWLLLEPGYYWLAAVTQGGTTQPTCSCLSGVTYPALSFFFGGNPGSAGVNGIQGTGGISGALPDPWGSTYGNSTFGQVPRVAIKVRAHHYA